MLSQHFLHLAAAPPTKALGVIPRETPCTRAAVEACFFDAPSGCAGCRVPGDKGAGEAVMVLPFVAVMMLDVNLEPCKAKKFRRWRSRRRLLGVCDQNVT
jgi:hypothetical protein